MNINTKTYKGIRGWTSESIIVLSEKHEVHITTMKRHSGAVATTATRKKIENGFASHVVFQDFSKCYTSVYARCTEKLVQSQHAAIVANANLIKRDCNEWYERKTM